MKWVTEYIKRYAGLILLGVVLVLSVVGTKDMLPLEYAELFLRDHQFAGVGVVALLMFFATVVAPVAMVPMIPMISVLLGPMLTALGCWLGWTLGAVVAFLIGRHGGRPLIERFVDLSTLQRFEARIPEEGHFAIIFALRIIIPVDIMSYALGFFSTVSLRTYTLASAVGILWFSIALSYLGYALIEQKTVLFIVYGVASAFIFLGALWYVKKVMRAK